MDALDYGVHAVRYIVKLVGDEERHVDHVGHGVDERPGGVGVGGVRCRDLMREVSLGGVTECARGLDLQLALTSFLPAVSSWMWFFDL